MAKYRTAFEAETIAVGERLARELSHARHEELIERGESLTLDEAQQLAQTIRAS